jgi:hypothetical protein
MPLQSANTRRKATAFSAICVGTQPRKASATTTPPQGPDFKAGPATIVRLDKGTFSLASPGAIGAGLAVEVTVVLPNAIASAVLDGATFSDLVLINAPITLEAGLDVGSERITAAGTL